MNSHDEVVHLLIRYRDPAGIDTILEHQKLLSAYGAVWFAKFGKNVGAQTVSRMQDQIARTIPTFLYLTNRPVAGSLRVYRATVAALNTHHPPSPETPLVPKYYGAVTPQFDVALWARVVQLEVLSEEGLDSLVTAGSGRPVRESLRGSSPFLVVTESGNQRHATGVERDRTGDRTK